MTTHRAFCEQTDAGTWLGGCRWCRTSFEETDEGRAQAWVSGHDSAVACQRAVARTAEPTFAPTGPGDALTLGDLREVADTADNWFGGEAEILVPADQAPLLYVFTPPTEEGWRRERLGVLHLDSGGISMAPHPDAIGGGGSE